MYVHPSHYSSVSSSSPSIIPHVSPSDPMTLSMTAKSSAWADKASVIVTEVNGIGRGSSDPSKPCRALTILATVPGSTSPMAMMTAWRYGNNHRPPLGVVSRLRIPSTAPEMDKLVTCISSEVSVHPLSLSPV